MVDGVKVGLDVKVNCEVMVETIPLNFSNCFMCTPSGTIPKRAFMKQWLKIAFPNGRAPLVGQYDPEGLACLTNEDFHFSSVSLPEIQMQENNCPNSKVSRVFRDIPEG